MYRYQLEEDYAYFYSYLQNYICSLRSSLIRFCDWYGYCNDLTRMLPCFALTMCALTAPNKQFSEYGARQAL
jgi:hypothetical protein